MRDQKNLELFMPCRAGPVAIANERAQRSSRTSRRAIAVAIASRVADALGDAASPAEKKGRPGRRHRLAEPPSGHVVADPGGASGRPAGGRRARELAGPNGR
jgi:hypothetical protein